jgi:DNA-directed RNA polymerase II subunit RPB1
MFRDSTSVVLPITSIELCVFGNDEKRRYSIANKSPYGLDLPDTIDKGEPVVNGVLDPRLGTTNTNRDCNTCGLDSEYCPCHMGHIRLPKDVYEDGYIVFVKKALSCTCFECSRIPVLINNPVLKNIIKNYPVTKKLDAIKNLTDKVKICPFCGAQKPKIKKDTKDSSASRLTKEYSIKKDNEDQIEEVKGKCDITAISGNEAFRKLENISDETAEMLGFCAKNYKMSDWMIRNFVISAPAIRPSVKADYLAEGTSEDDLTKKSLEVVKQCATIRGLMNNPDNAKSDHYIDNHTQLLQYHTSVFRNNDSKSMPKSEQKAGGKAMKSITERIQGKEGRLRHDLEGKRTNFCARSVISADPNISIDEVGVPQRVAKILTIPVTVTATNIQELTRYVKNGRSIYPGANYIKQKSRNATGRRFLMDLKNARNVITLHIGDIVERHLLDGDPCLMNRQPSLHKLSILCHRIRVIDDSTISPFRLNVNVTAPYGADFDGDEMNMYIAQSPQEIIENLMLAHVDKHILTPRNSHPIISFKQDTPAGIYLMTESEQDINWHDAMNIAMHIEGFDMTKLKKKNITTYNLFSFILPKMINYEKWCDGKKIVNIVNGELLFGKITGNILTDVLIMAIWDRYGPKQTRIFINNAQHLAEMYLFMKGMTIGYSDTIPTSEIKDKSKKHIYGKILESSNLLTEIENNPKLLDSETFEKNLLAILQSVKPDVAAMAFKMLENTGNNFFALVVSKAKGSDANIGAIMAGKGQEILKYARIDKTVNGRCLPHICYNDDTARNRGFIVNAYHEGMDPIEFWFYHQGGREGLINTSIKTAESGYQQRRLIKALEAIMAMYDGTIRTSNGVILQLLYGDSQLDQTMQKKVKLRSIEMSNIEMNNAHLFTNDELKSFDKDVKKKNKEYVDELISMRDEMRIIQLKSHFKYGTLITDFYQAANYSRIINDIKNTNDADSKSLSPTYIIEQIENILSHEKTALVYYTSNEKNPIKHKNEQRFKFLFKYALYEYLSPKQIILVHKLNKTKFDIVVSEIIISFNKALIQAGEMVGILAAQSMGEPLTQMTLSSFHKSGSGVAGLQGTPRLRELLGRVKVIATPIMFIYMLEKYREDKQLVNKIAASLKFTTCKDIILKSSTIYDPNNIFTDTDNMDTGSVFSINMINDVDLKSLPWLFRIHLDREKISEYDITMLDIKIKFINFWNEIMLDNKKTKPLLGKINNACIITNYINSTDPIIHIRLELNNIDEKTLSEFQNIMFSCFYIKGNEKFKKIDEIAHDALIHFDKDSGDVIRSKEYVIYSAGINFEKIREIPYIDQNRTICNDIKVVHELYGIESARSLLLKEINGIFSDSINYHHIIMVCDLMTHTGNITSIDRFGINKLGIGVLSRATFEKTMEILTYAAVYNQTDHLKNVSSSIMLGKPFRGGTGLCSVSMDNDILENSEFGASDRDDKTQMNLSKMNIISDILNNKDNRNLFIPLME